MSLLYPGPQTSFVGRVRRALSFLADHNTKLKEAFEWSDWVAAALTILLLLSWMKRWAYPEWLQLVAELIHVLGAVLIASYLCLRMLFVVARAILPRREGDILSDSESDLNWKTPCSPDVILIDPTNDPAEYQDNLKAAVHLCHDSLGFEHDQFSTSKRRALYDRWCKASSRSMLLVKPQFGMARGQPIGVTIILPLTPEGLIHMQAKDGGVLTLEGKHIVPAGRPTPILLIDTLLLADKWIKAYGPTALKALIQHIALFYNPRSWLNTELYCSMYQAGTIGRYLPGVRALIDKRGFHEFGKTSEGETIFRLCMRSLAADPLTRERYRMYVSALQECSQSHKAVRIGKPLVNDSDPMRYPRTSQSQC